MVTHIEVVSTSFGFKAVAVSLFGGIVEETAPVATWALARAAAQRLATYYGVSVYTASPNPNPYWGRLM